MSLQIVRVKSEFKGSQAEWNEILANAMYVINAANDQTVISSKKDQDTDKPMTEDDVNASGKEPYGSVPYADDKGFQKDGKKRYPIDTESHIRSAHNYFSKPSNYEKYTPEQRAHIKGRIDSAWRRVISKDGPPSDQK